MYCLIMAGGIGKRFWPRSRKNYPKQLLNIVSEDSMLKLTYDRLLKITPKEKIFIVAGESLKHVMLENLGGFPEENFIIEPTGKNTAPCIALAAAIISKNDPNAVMGVFPADHLIENFESFREAVETGEKVATNHSGLVTFGITPTRPATGYGYIQYDKKLPLLENSAYKVKTFAEKPNLETAKRFLDSGEFLWNSGMFIWKAKDILTSIKAHLSDLFESVINIQAAYETPNYSKVLRDEWATILASSIDYGVMEKANNVYVVKSDFVWSDVGSWDAVYDLEKKNEEGNSLQGDVIAMDTKNCLISSQKRLVATIGVEGLIIIETKDAILVARRGESEKIKDLVDLLKRNEKNEYL
ncbi:MAG: mannose-1-phosphate guanylyltransferase [Candidatus Marinimicrobia bacterium]|nr:mannose-1-phosphate guanylyltransferase [Candidatus Neomarinimicrobiota bacterium]